MTIGRGHLVKSHYRNILGVRELVSEDLLRLKEKRTKIGPHVQKLRDSHHAVARALAMGKRDWEVKELTGYSLQRIYTLKGDPSFLSLVEHYRGLVNQSFVENADAYMALMTENGLRAERMIADKLDEAEAEGTLLPVKDLLAISRDAADRNGRGKRQTNVNVNVDFASALEKAIKRSDAAKVIDGEVVTRRLV